MAKDATFTLEEDFFSDSSILEQDSCMISDGDFRTNGMSLTVKCFPTVESVEVLLTYEELKAALEYLEKDREAMPHIYSENN